MAKDLMSGDVYTKAVATQEAPASISLYCNEGADGSNAQNKMHMPWTIDLAFSDNLSG